MKTRKPRKLLALLLSMVMVLSMSITAFAEETEDDAELTNYIYSLDRLVQQDGETLLHGVTDWTVTEDGTGSEVTYEDIDIFPVDEKNGVTVTYDATMNMEELKLSGNYFEMALQYGSVDDAWELLQKYYYCIENTTVIHLVFDMDEDVLLSEVELTELASQIELVSDMFTFSGEAEDLDINTSDGNNTLTITCYWNSTNATAAMAQNGELDPMIYLYNVELPITSSWNNDDDEEEEDYLTIINHGSVDGTMYASGIEVTVFNQTKTLDDLEWEINGGSEDDVFVLTTEDVKISAPGITKKIWVDTNNNGTIDNGELVDADSVDAGTDVTFYLKSNIPQTLLKDTYIWADSEDDESEDESEGESSDGTSTTGLDDDLAVVDAVVDETATYVITFHDVLDSNFTLDTNSFTVTIGDKTIGSSYYTLTTSCDDGCTFEISIDLIALYLAGVIDDDDISGCAEIVVTYTATLNADADSGCYTNDAWVTYPDGETEDDKVRVYDYEIDVWKYEEVEVESDDEDSGDGDSESEETETTQQALAGAGFVLFKYAEATYNSESGLTYYTLEADYEYTEVDDSAEFDSTETYYTATTDSDGNTTYTACTDLTAFESGTTYYTRSISGYTYVEATSGSTDSTETYYVRQYYKEVTETSTDEEGNETATVTGITWVDDVDDATVKYSDTDGNLSFTGLAEGTYYLLETDPPTGYVASGEAVEFVVGTSSVTTYVYSVNVENSAIPETGGMGTTLIYLAGLVLVILAGVILVARKRRDAEAG